MDIHTGKTDETHDARNLYWATLLTAKTAEDVADVVDEYALKGMRDSIDRVLAVHEARREKEKTFVVMVPQLGSFEKRPFYFDHRWSAQTFAEETGGDVYEARK